MFKGKSPLGGKCRGGRNCFNLHMRAIKKCALFYEVQNKTETSEYFPAQRLFTFYCFLIG